MVPENKRELSQQSKKLFGRENGLNPEEESSKKIKDKNEISKISRDQKEDQEHPKMG